MLPHNTTQIPTTLALFRDPSISPEGPRTTEPLLDELRKRNEELVDKHAENLYHADAATIMQWAQEFAPGRVVVTLSMENTVLAELAARHAPDMDFLFLDSADEQAQEYGPNLYQSNPAACCRMRKVEPLAVSLSPYVGWVTGLRRADGPTRTTTPALALDSTGRLKISPLVTWSLEDTERFITDNNLIKHPLTHQGYPSIGCATCTLPVAAGEDPRAGRWAGHAKTECGLHT